MNSLLIIGGTGFFGKSILDAFKRGLLNPWKVSMVIVMARNASSLAKTAPELVNDNVSLVDADITKATELPFAEFVIHAAASTDLRDYLARPSEEKANIEAGTLNYCNLANKYHKKSKIVYVSSGAVYGVQPSNLEYLSENNEMISSSNMAEGKVDYALGKITAEKAIIDLGKSGLNVSIARCFAFVGRWLPRDQHFAVGNFIEDALNNRSILVKAKYKVYRSYMYADDLVEWLMAVANQSSQLCPIYNVGSDDAIHVGDLAKIISAKMNVGLNQHPISSLYIDRYIPSVEKAKLELGLTVKYDLELAIEETIKRILETSLL